MQDLPKEHLGGHYCPTPCASVGDRGNLEIHPEISKPLNVQGTWASMRLHKTKKCDLRRVSLSRGFVHPIELLRAYYIAGGLSGKGTICQRTGYPNHCFSWLSWYTPLILVFLPWQMFSRVPATKMRVSAPAPYENPTVIVVQSVGRLPLFLEHEAATLLRTVFHDNFPWLPLCFPSEPPLLQPICKNYPVLFWI